MWHTVQRWLHARLVLGVALGWRLVKDAWRPRRDDAQRWLRAMQRERLGPTPRSNWLHYEGASRCIACGLCDQFATPALPNPSAVMLGAARLQADALEFAQTASALRAIAADIERVCPTHASATAVADVLDGHRGALHSLEPAGDAPAS